MGDGKKAVRYARGQVICILLAALFTLGAYVNTGRIQQQSLQSFYYYDYQMPADLEGFKTIYEDSVAEKKNLGVILRGKDIEDSTLFLNFPKGKGQYIRSLVLQIRDLSRAKNDALKQLSDLQQKIEELETTLENVSSPEYIESQARSQLHMIYPNEVLYIVEDE